MFDVDVMAWGELKFYEAKGGSWLKVCGMSLCLHFSSSIQRLKYILVALNQKFNQRKQELSKDKEKDYIVGFICIGSEF